MPFNKELSNKLTSFLAGDLSLSAYRQEMMRFRVESLESLQERDKNFVYEFETRYAQLQAQALTEYQFKQLLTYAAACESASTNRQPDMWFHLEPPKQETVVGTNSIVPTSTNPANQELVLA